MTDEKLMGTFVKEYFRSIRICKEHNLHEYKEKCAFEDGRKHVIDELESFLYKHKENQDDK